jgi:PAS domain S-box-containing protein
MPNAPTTDSSGINDLSLQAIVETTPECIKIVAPDGSLSFMNFAGLCMVEASSMSQVQGACIFDVIAPEHRKRWIENHNRVCNGESMTWQFEIIGLSGSRRYMETHAVPLPNGNGNFSQLAVTRDITERRKAEEALKRNQIILQGQNRALELAINGSPMSEVLEVLTHTVEKHSNNKIFASILLVDRDGKRLIHGAAPNLPEKFNKAIDGIYIGPSAGSCGTAAYLKEDVIVSNIGKDPLWKDFRSLAEEHGLEACWSTPITSSSDVIGTFALYYTTPQSPTAEERNAVQLLSRTAGIIIERFREAKQRREAEQAYESTDQHLRALITATNDVVYRMNHDWSVMQPLDGRKFLANTDEPIRDWLQKYIHPDDQKFVMDSVNEAVKNRKIFQLEHRVLRADNTIGWTLSRAIPITNSEGNVVEWFGAASDVTQRKMIEQALIESEEKFRAMADNIPNLAWMANADGWITWYNRKWYDYTGTTAEQMEGWGWQIVHDPVELPKVIEKWKSSLDTGKPFEMIFPLKGADGVFRPFLTRVLPVKNAEGKIVRWFGTNTDVTTQKQEEEKLERLVKERTAQLERSNQDLLQFAHVASHDLKEPLRKIQTFADKIELALSDTMPANVKQYLDKINIASERLSNMIAGVLSYSQMNSENQSTSLVDLNKVLSHIQNDLEITIQQTGATIEISDLPTIEGAEVLLHQLFYNLINNSIKFRKKEVAPAIRISCSSIKNDKAHLIVSDNGIGFDPQFAEVIFDTFSRLHPKDRFEGTGLGLSLCKKIVSRHNGSIWAESTKNHGSIFHIDIPLRQSAGKI